jgi:uncharacterized protein YndB with AHSA1/START domain
MGGSVTLHIDAPPERVWELVTDVTRIGEFSPETFEAEWLDGASGPAEGARFRGHVRRNGHAFMVYWTTCTVSVAEAPRRFAFWVGPPDTPWNTWSYELEPSGGGTDVTESFQLSALAALRLYWALLGWSRGRTNRRGMQATLERLKAVAEAP